ncbi:sensor histidine kinase [Paractinoplanes durhamensis]|uniref:histidine kinase n=1 Tax=Paractinoplanes durhamensis TaxID=113563 RepID=A0ABQ3Z841_9ACTN|nr:histidine kinase [Actinoplanes durhamensis]GIE05699.1 two-component sensor histidine kinase [Actinoplanes durhamensis]
MFLRSPPGQVLRNWLAGLGIGALSAVGALMVVHREDGNGLGPRPGMPLAADLGAAAGAAVAIGLSGTFPLPVLVLSTLAEIFCLVRGWGSPAPMFAMVVALYHLAVRAPRRLTWSTAVLCGALCWIASGAGSHTGWWNPLSLGLFAWTGMAAAGGDAVRNRRAYVTEVEERARRAEQNREDEVHRRVGEERLRIARELHDVVAHHIAVINVQAGAAAYALPRQPEAAGPPLAHIRQAAGIVVQELASIVGLLRDDGEQDREPAPGIEQLPRLFEAFAAAGVRVEYVPEGEPRPLPASGNLAAYRITQEALTNARKHGDGGPVRVSFRYGREHLAIEITNGVVPGGASGTEAGYGLIGMRERAASAGGRVEARLMATDLFAVRVELPAPRLQEQLS